MSIIYKELNWAFLEEYFGTLLAKTRRTEGLTQAELGQLCGLDATTISNIETGHGISAVSIRNFLTICNVLDIKPTEAFGLQE